MDPEKIDISGGDKKLLFQNQQLKDTFEKNGGFKSKTKKKIPSSPIEKKKTRHFSSKVQPGLTSNETAKKIRLESEVTPHESKDDGIEELESVVTTHELKDGGIENSESKVSTHESKDGGVEDFTEEYTETSINDPLEESSQDHDKAGTDNFPKDNKGMLISFLTFFFLSIHAVVKF